jgi:hypothetical protein
MDLYKVNGEYPQFIGHTKAVYSAAFPQWPRPGDWRADNTARFVGLPDW